MKQNELGERRKRFSPAENRDNLPKELLKELYKSDTRSQKTLRVFQEGGGTLNVSEALIGFYKIHKLVKTRRYITGTLYHLAQKGLLHRTEKRGEYTIDEVSHNGTL